MEEFEKKDQEEKKASRVDAEYDEIMQLCGDIKERIEESREVTEAEKKKQEQEKTMASDMWQIAMETLAGTKKRKEPSGEENPKRSSRRKFVDTLKYLKESMDVKKQQMEDEKELRQRELKVREDELKQQQQQQQAQTQFMMQMLQNQNEMFKQLTDIIQSNNAWFGLI